MFKSLLNLLFIFLLSITMSLLGYFFGCWATESELRYKLTEEQSKCLEEATKNKQRKFFQSLANKEYTPDEILEVIHGYSANCAFNRVLINEK